MGGIGGELESALVGSAGLVGVAELYDRLVERPHRRMVGWLEQRFMAAGVEPPHLPALAIVLIEAMASYRSMRETFGRSFDDIDDDRFVAGWVEIAVAVAERHRL